MIKNFFFLVCTVCFVVNLAGQTFSAGVVLGFNASQINGDLIAGFDKLGLQGGLKVMSRLSEKSDWSIELLYSERGSRSKTRFSEPFKIVINYVEIPVMIGLKDWLQEDYYKMRLEGGISFGRLIDSRVETIGGDLSVEEFRDTDFSLLVGATFYAKKNLGFSVRYTQSIIPLVNNVQNPIFPRLRSFFLTFRTIYLL